MIAGTTGIGSLPTSNVDDAIAMPFGEDLRIPYLAELPGRGPGADIIGRTAAVLVDLFVELHPSAWRLTRRSGVDLRRANDYWSWDLDALQRSADGYAGPLKIQLAGPWTLAASLELPNGHRVLTDHGAVADLHASLAEGAVALLAEIRRRVPGAQAILQLDEPALPAVLAGAVPTASGAGRLDAVGSHEAGAGLQQVVAAAGVDVLVHSCAADVPFGLLHASGVSGVLFDAELFTEAHYDELGEAVDAGLVPYAGVVPPSKRPSPARVDAWAERARRIASVLGISGERISEQLGITTACGLAGSSWQGALAATRAVTDVARKIRDTPEAADD